MRTRLVLSFVMLLCLAFASAAENVIVMDETHVYGDPGASPPPEDDTGESDNGYRPGPYGDCMTYGDCPQPNARQPSASQISYDWRNPEAFCDAHQTCEKVKHRRQTVDRTVSVNETNPQKRRVAVEQGLHQPPVTTRNAQTIPDVAPPGPQPPGRDGDPVVLSSGALRLQYIDFSFPGPVRPLEFRRYYDSRSDLRSTLGSNWSHNFDTLIEEVTEHNAPGWAPAACKHANSPCVLVYRAGASELMIRVEGRDYYLAPQGGSSTLRRVGDWWYLTGNDGRVERFNDEGYLVEDRDRFGNGYTIEYEPTPLYLAFKRYCSYFGQYIANEDARLCEALKYVFGEGHRQKWNTWGPLPDNQLKTIVCDTLPPNVEVELVVSYSCADVPQPDGSLVCATTVLPSEWQCAGLGWVRTSGRIPVPVNTKTRVHYLDPGLTYAIVALPDEARYRDVIYPAMVSVFGDDLSPDVPRPAELTPGLAQAQAELREHLDRGTIDVGILGSRGSVYHTPENRYGGRRLRPVRVVDDLGRELSFQYFGGDSMPDAGLLRKVNGPGGVSVAFSYRTPIAYPQRLDERFLTRVERNVDAPDPPGPACFDGCSRADQPIRHDYQYAWRNPNVSEGYWKNDVAVWSRLAATRRVDTGTGGFTGFPGAPPTTPPPPDLSAVASLEALRYIETQADNLVRVSRSFNDGTRWSTPVVELETRYGANPDQPDRTDRVIAQRYGTAQTQATSPAAGFDTGYPEYKFSYSQATRGDEQGPALFLPAELRALYPREPVPTRLSASFTRSVRESILASRPFNLVYFTRTWPSEDRVTLRRTPITCAEIVSGHFFQFERHPNTFSAAELDDLRRRQAADANRICAWTKTVDRDGTTRYRGFNYAGATLVDAVFDPMGPRYLISENIYGDAGLLVEARRPFASDASPPQILARGSARFKYAGVSDTSAVAWRGRLNLAQVSDVPTGGHVEDTKDDANVTVAAHLTEYDYEPVFNQVARIARNALDADGSLRKLYQVRTEYSAACNLRIVDRFDEICGDDSTCVLRNSLADRLGELQRRWEAECSGTRCEFPLDPKATRRIGRELAAMDDAELKRAGAELEAIANKVEVEPIAIRAPGERRGDAPGKAYRAAALRALDAARLRAGLVGPGFKFPPAVVNPNPCGKLRPERLIHEVPDHPATRRVTELSWAAHGLPRTIEEQGGGKLDVQYFDSTYDDELLRRDFGVPDENWISPEDACRMTSVSRPCRGKTSLSPSVPGPDGRGFPARLQRERFDADFGAMMPADGCAALAGPYRWLLPACGTANGDLTALELPTEVQSAMLAAADGRAPPHVERYRARRNGWQWWMQRGDETRHLFRRDIDGRVVLERGSDGRLTRTRRDETGRPISEERLAADGVTAVTRNHFRWYPNGALSGTCVELTLGGCTQFAVDGTATYAASSATPTRQLRTYTYTGEGRLRRDEDPGRRRLEYVYDARGLTTLETGLDLSSFEGRTLRLAWDKEGRLEKIEQGHGAQILRSFYQYDALGRLQSTVDRRGLTCVLAHTSRDELSRLECGPPKKTIPGPTWYWSYTYNDHGELARTDDNGAVVTETTWGPWGRSGRVQITGEGARYFALDTAGALAWFRNADDSRWFTARSLDRAFVATGSIIGAAEARRSTYEIFALDAHGRLLERQLVGATGTGGRAKLSDRYERNDAGVIRHEYRADGTVLRYSSNAVGWPYQLELLANGVAIRSSSIRHDQAGRVRRLTDPNGVATEFGFDAFGSMTRLTQPGPTSFSRRWTYDPLGRLATRIEPDGSTTRAQYNEFGDLRAVFRGNQLLRDWEYDLFGRIVAQRETNSELSELAPPERIVRQTFDYDARSTIAKMTIRLGTREPLGTGSEWIAQPQGWMRRLTLPSGSIDVAQWDDAAQWLRLVTSRSNTEARWQAGVLRERNTAAGSWSLQELDSYDPFSRRYETRYSDSTGGALATIAVRDAAGRALSSSRKAPAFPQDLRYRYDPASRLDGIARGASLAAHVEGIGDVASVSFTGAETLDLKRDAIGELLQVEPDPSADSPWRHAGQRGPGYRLNAVSLFASPAHAVTHDGQGRVAKFGPWTYQYGDGGRLLRVRRDGDNVEAYAYTADGTLAAVLSPGKVERLVSDRGRIVAAYDGSRLGWEASWVPDSAVPIEWRSADATLYALADERQSVAGWVRNGGPMVDVSYDAYGRMTAAGATDRCTERAVADVCALKDLPPFGFGGAWRSSRTGLVKMGERWYSPVLGQFLTHDPAGVHDGFSQYAYTAGDPVNRWDRTGTEGRGIFAPDDVIDVTPVKDTWFVDVTHSNGSHVRYLASFDENNNLFLGRHLCQNPADYCYNDPNHGTGVVESDPAGDILIDIFTGAILAKLGFSGVRALSELPKGSAGPGRMAKLWNGIKRVFGKGDDVAATEGKVAGSVARNAKEAALIAKRLERGDSKKMIGEARDLVAKAEGTPTQRADLFEKYCQQIKEAHGGWGYTRATTGDGAQVFVALKDKQLGGLVVIAADGKMYTGKAMKSIVENVNDGLPVMLFLDDLQPFVPGP